jgi:hypothetical protein
MFLIFFKQDDCGSLPGEIWISSPGMDAVREVVELKQVLDKFECLLKITNRTLLRIRGLFYSLDSQVKQWGSQFQKVQTNFKFCLLTICIIPMCGCFCCVCMRLYMPQVFYMFVYLSLHVHIYW